ncbi:uncharacterized protein LOC110717701 isoform X1 [Chenopodium quinoa]|uniref:uncharacterized protein LOC110717701 isoform X1 n=1 Tax=Chenopodium quinoa TaxID=63459 RepID=UPI000B788907|nr:uncharacterized protein LOC110717701 isoform X1 [Chenopodium quinoa]
MSIKLMNQECQNRLRMETIRKNMTRMEELGLKEQAKSLMAQVQNNRGNQSKNKKKNVSGDDELYRPNQDMEHELDSTNEELPIPQSKSKDKSNAIQWKIRKMKALTRKAAMAKRRRNVDLASSHGGSSTPNHTLHQHYSTTREPVEMLGLEVEHLNHDKNDKENAEKDKPRRGPTMCYKVHGRSEEERLEITLNEHGQPVGPDDSTCNEFISFLGTIARKANILPLTVKNWPILRNEKKEELWDYVLERCMQNKENRLVGKEKNIMLHTSGPKSFARVRYKWKKDNKTTKNPSLAQMFIATRKEKLTKRKPGDLRDKLMTEIEKLDSEEEVESVISTIIGFDNKKKSRLNFHGRGVSSTQLKQKALMKEAEEKHAQEARFKLYKKIMRIKGNKIEGR